MNEPSQQLPAHLGELTAEIDGLRETGAMFYQRGWSLGTSSNYSIILSHDPVELLVTASGKDKGRLTRHDFVRVDGQGKPTVADQPKSSAETLLHTVLAEQPNVGSVLHTHSVWSTLLSEHFFDNGGFFIEDYEMLKGLDGVSTHQHQEWVTIFDNTQDIPSLSKKVADKMASPDEAMQHGFLIRQHGLYTWGTDLAAARRQIEIFEFLFECVARKLMLSGVIPSAAVV